MFARRALCDGKAYSIAKDTALATQASATTLVISPIMTVCVSCHDKKVARDHMTANGGSFYAPRSTVIDATGHTQEQCMLCHGPGRIAAVGEVHQ